MKATSIIPSSTAPTYPAAQDPGQIAHSPAVSTDAKPGLTRFDSIDGLRGIACLMVLAFHCYTLADKHPLGTFHWFGQPVAATDLLKHGYTGVDLFFILSGFCLSYPILSKPHKPVDWRRYAVNRMRRLLPPYYAALLLLTVFSFTIRHFQPQPLYPGILPWPGLKELISSFLLLHFALNGSFWTLVLEWRWYFIFPLLILLMVRGVRGAGIFALSLPVSALFLFLYNGEGMAKAKFLTTDLPSVLCLFALGIWGAEIAVGHRRTPFEQKLLDYSPWGIAVGVLLVGVLAKNGNHIHWTRIVSWGPLYFFLLLAALHSKPFIQLFSWRPLVQAGIFSYSLYLINDPLIRAADLYIRPLNLAPIWKFIAYQGVLFWVVILVAYLFFWIAERPFLHKPARREVVPASAAS